MRLILLILLLLPVSEVLLSLWLYREFGDGFLLWLGATAIAGLLLVMRARRSLSNAFSFARTGSQRAASSALLALLAGARTLIAGLLLIFPGLLTDCGALLLLVIPGRVVSLGPKAANDDVIDAEFRVLQDEPRLPRS